MEPQTTVCPTCQGKLTILKTGKTFCRTCGVSKIESLDDDEPTSPTSPTLPKAPPPPPKLVNSSHTQMPRNNQPQSKRSSSSDNNVIEQLKSRQFYKFVPESLMVVGALTMLMTLFLYGTSVCDDNEFSSSCTYNIGLMNNKSNLINVGGFLFVGSCALLNDRQE